MPDDSLGDWRIEAVDILRSDLPATSAGAPRHKAGTPIYESTHAKNRDGKDLAFITPSPTALALSIAIKVTREAMILRDNIKFKDIITPYGTANRVTLENTGYLFDYFEKCMIVAIFSFQAIEAFCNEQIEKHVLGTYQIERKGKMENCSSEKLQRSISTEEKLSTILPDILKKESPKNKPIWKGFKQLKH